MAWVPEPNLLPNPNVRIVFTGLIILEPIVVMQPTLQGNVPINACQAHIHNQSPDHDLLIEVRRKRTGKPDVVMMRRPEPFVFTGADSSRTHGLLIQTNVPPAQKGVKAY